MILTFLTCTKTSLKKGDDITLELINVSQNPATDRIPVDLSGVNNEVEAIGLHLYL